jgi:hypothetical protein
MLRRTCVLIFAISASMTFVLPANATDARTLESSSCAISSHCAWTGTNYTGTRGTLSPHSEGYCQTFSSAKRSYKKGSQSTIGGYYYSGTNCTGTVVSTVDNNSGRWVSNMSTARSFLHECVSC